MARVKRIDPECYMRAPHFSQAVEIIAPTKLVFVAGQVAGDGFGAVECEGFEGQLNAVFDRISTILQTSGASLSDIVKINGFITDRSNVSVWRKVFLERLGEVRPISTVVIAQLTDRRLLVEVDAVAVAAEK